MVEERYKGIVCSFCGKENLAGCYSPPGRGWYCDENCCDADIQREVDTRLSFAKQLDAKSDQQLPNNAHLFTTDELRSMLQDERELLASAGYIESLIIVTIISSLEHEIEQREKQEPLS